MTTPQARWAKKQKRKGCCTRCGKPRGKHKQLCDEHQAEFTAYMKAWRARRKIKTKRRR
jgi:hypothetical protein